MCAYFDNKKLFQMPVATQHGSHMVTTNVSKENKIKYINIDTRFCDDYNALDSADYIMNLPDRLTNIKSMTVMNVEVPVSFYNISAALGNNTFRITNQDTEQSVIITIPDNQYTPTLLTAKINSLLQAYDVGLTFTLNSNNQSVISLAVGDTNSYYLEFYTDSSGANDRFNLKFKLGWLLGYRFLSYPLLAGGVLVSETPINLNGPRYFYLVIDEFQNGNQNSFTSALSTSIIRKNMIARITAPYNIYPFGSVIPANLENGLLTSDTRSYTGKIDIQRMNIQLVSENGLTMNLNGEDISFCLKLEYD